MEPTEQARQDLTRRWFLPRLRRRPRLDRARVAPGRVGAGATGDRSRTPLLPKTPHFAPKAKRVIFLFQAGAPSHIDLFDDKPALRKHDGTLPPPELLKGYRAAFINPSSTLLAPKFKFHKYGQSGRSCRSSCLISARSSTTWRSSGRW